MIISQVPPRAPPYRGSGSRVNAWETAMTDQTFRKELGVRIKALRKERKLTQKELAQKLNITFGQLNKYESGLSAPPPDMIVTLASSLSVSADYLLTGRTRDGAPLGNVRLIDRLKIAEKFPSDDQETVVKFLDAMIVQYRAKSLMLPADQLIPAS